LRPIFIFALNAVAGSLLLSTVALASGPDPAKYPLRVHILKFTSQSRHSREAKTQSDSPDYMDGMGVADLFENGQPRGFQFTYSCIGGMKASGGYASFPARWKKREKTLEILLPETGKPWNLEACELHAEISDELVYYWKNGSVAVEGAAVLKAWMTKHQYDPEKDQNEPVMAAGESEISDPQVAGPD
jgi:hypothetical protein